MSDLRKLLVTLVAQEGSVIYSDDAGRENVQALSCIVVTQYVGRPGVDSGPVMTTWKPIGSITLIAESLATWFANEPGLKDAVDGLYALIQKRKPQH